MTSSQDRFSRFYLFREQQGVADADTVATLLSAVATELRGIGVVDVHDLVLAQNENAAAPSVSVTVYYNRHERRLNDRA